ncbi:MAG TPA: hypothetical protein EYP53_06865 [Candidatus Latescibacteria bacterium]|nr:hypothetical protein [Candidatus Latescibacterota bacterium]
MGIDDTISIRVPYQHHPEVTVRTWREVRADEPYPLLCKEYETPKGTVRQVVWQTEDWPHGDDVPLIGDHNIPRSRKFPVEEPEDLEKLPYLLFPPSGEQMKEFKEKVERVERFARKRQVLIEGQAGGFGDCAAWLMGITNLIMAAIDKPDFVHRLLDILLEKEMQDIEILLDSGLVDVVVHRGWYECSDFWSPSLYREFSPPLEEGNSACASSREEVRLYYEHWYNAASGCIP